MVRFYFWTALEQSDPPKKRWRLDNIGTTIPGRQENILHPWNNKLTVVQRVSLKIIQPPETRSTWNLQWHPGGWPFHHDAKLLFCTALSRLASLDCHRLRVTVELWIYLQLCILFTFMYMNNNILICIYIYIYIIIRNVICIIYIYIVFKYTHQSWYCSKYVQYSYKICPHNSSVHGAGLSHLPRG